MVYLPAATLLFEWFQKHRGAANGVMYCKLTEWINVYSSLADIWGFQPAPVSSDQSG